jgi:hypothetical protein
MEAVFALVPKLEGHESGWPTRELLDARICEWRNASSGSSTLGIATQRFEGTEWSKV